MDKDTIGVIVIGYLLIIFFLFLLLLLLLSLTLNFDPLLYCRGMTNSNKNLIGTWNINGFNSKLFGNKFDDRDLHNAIKDHDIVGFTETHLPKDETLSLPGFSALFVKCRQKSDKNNKASGGIAVFIRNYLSLIPKPFVMFTLLIKI